MSDERAMMTKIERGERLESADEMTADYRDNLVHLMTMQADSELAGCYGPWVRAIEGIFKEEKFHIRHGEYWVKKLAEDPATRAEAQATFAKWYVRTMNIFGRPGSPKNVRYRTYRLKTRDNDEVRQAFATEVAGLCEKVGLLVPAWKPVWEQLPEEAQIPG